MVYPNLVQYYCTPEMPIESTALAASFYSRETTGIECMGRLTCLTTITCSVPPQEESTHTDLYISVLAHLTHDTVYSEAKLNSKGKL